MNESGEKVECILKGEVKKSETINYRTLKPEKDGLYCEVIFGPTKDYQCACGKSRKNTGERKVCEKCGVELTESKVRRERMGYIALAAPVVHIWYLRNTPSKIAILLDMKAKDVLEIAALSSYIITEVLDDTIEDIFPGRIITQQEHSRYSRMYFGKYKVKTGAEAIKFLLQSLNLKEIVDEIRAELKVATKQRREKLIKRLEIVEAFYHSTNKPEWMVMDVVPVIPPDLRPMVQLDGGRFATTDLNDLYRRIISRNNRLRKQIEIRSPEMIIKNEKRMLQEAVDSLIDNSKRKNKAAVDKNRPLKSLSDILRGKQGRFRQNLLGKRVDYSGRSVIVIGPDLKMYQAGIPREMALILFKPFIINYLRQKEQNEMALTTTDGVLQMPISKDKAGVKRAKELIERGAPEAMEALEKVVVEHPVLLNRAPTLHRLSIQAFEPKLVEGKAIRLHPLVTTAFNADFDGDQMPVHVPLSEEAQAEARLLMLASKNILAPKDGKPVVTPSQDMILGNYYLSIERSQIDREYKTFEDVYLAYLTCEIEFNNQIIVNDELTYRDVMALKKDIEAGIAPSVGRFFVPGREGKAFSSEEEVIHAYEKGDIDFHTRFVIPGKAIAKPFVHLDPKDSDYEEKVKLNDELKNQYLITTYGKMIFNQVFPENFVYVNEPERKNLAEGTPLRYFVKKGENYKEIIKNAPLVSPFKKGMLSMSISEVFRQSKLAETSKTLDKMKDLGFKYSTIAGITVSAFDVVVAEEKREIIAKAEEIVKKYNQMYRRGTMLRAEKSRMVIEVWNTATKDIEASIKKKMQVDATKNHIFMMADSGARGSSSNFTQLAGMRGLMAKPNGESMEIPVKGCFIEGMSMSEFFISTHGARKGSTDTALKTAESGYLTRRLVDVSQDITITCDDCGTDKGMVVKTLYNKDPEKTPNGYSDKNICVNLKDRIIGRFAAKPVVARVDGKKTVLVDKGEFITEAIAQRIVDAKVEEVSVRTLLTCDAKTGVCIKCYGSDLSTTGIVERGEVVGIVAAQSIGEPGTQLTMRTFHSGGVATSGDDITQGLPRIQELFEAREPKGKGIISEIKGVVSNVNVRGDNRTEITVESPIEGNSKTYLTDAGKKSIVEVGEAVQAGDLLSEGLIHPKELLRVAPVEKVVQYILKEVQKVYRSTGVAISDKHVEIIVKQMLQKVVVIDEGDTELLPGTFISKPEIYRIIKECYDNGRRIPVVKPVILGITRASLKADSFLSAASFQETTRVLTEAAIRGKIDRLEGLKENIIIGGLIPAGTGLVDEEDVHIEEDYMAPLYDVKK
ncbi:MAG: DNA-directed RNA polymerase subunit beta' [Anaeroplasma bactoclasticum]|nr:DNA-directed RNA polymerase subunit beta' [Anaeroplasma bactoclasticum]